MNHSMPQSPVHLLDIIVQNYQQHYIDKLIRIAHGRNTHLFSKSTQLQRRREALVYLTDIEKVRTY